jgi:flagellar FliJ protein
MRFRFRLQKLLEARKITQDLAQKDFQLELSALQTLNEKLRLMDQERSESFLRSGLLQEQGGPDAGRALHEIHEFQEGLAQRRVFHLEKIKQAEELVEKKREILRQSTIEYRIIVKLREKDFQKFQQELANSAQKESDEIATLRFAHKDVK